MCCVSMAIRLILGFKGRWSVADCLLSSLLPLLPTDRIPLPLPAPLLPLSQVPTAAYRSPKCPQWVCACGRTARTHSNLPCRPSSPSITVVRGGSVWSNGPELTRTCPVGLPPPSSVVRGGSVWSNRPELTLTCPVGLLPPPSQWFEKVRCCRTAANSLTQYTRTVMKVRVSSERFDNTEWIRQRRDRTSQNHCEAGLQSEFGAVRQGRFE